MKKIVFALMISFLFVTFSYAADIKKDKDFDAGLKYYFSGKYKEAVKSFKAYVAEKPSAAAYYLIGYSLYELEKFDESEQYFKEAFLIDPDFSLEKVGLIKKAPAPAPAPASEKAVEPKK